jgi:uncharacterized membrane protein YebE (DUF533 family)
MGIGKLLGSISPVYGAVTGRGVFGDVQKALGPAAGLAFQAGKAYRDDKKNKAEAAASDAAKKADFDAKRRAASGMTMKKGGKVKKMASGGSTASKRADGCATKGKTKGRFV